MVYNPELINKLVKVKINDCVHEIRIMEEPISAAYSFLCLAKQYNSSEICISDDSDCVFATLDSLEKVPETVLSSSLQCAVVDDGQSLLNKGGSRKLVFQILKIMM